MSIELTHEDVIRLVRSIPFHTLSLEQLKDVSSLKEGAKCLYYWDWKSIDDKSWEVYTTKYLYELYLKLK